MREPVGQPATHAAAAVELLLLIFFFACWLGVFVSLFAALPLAGALDVGLYALYGIAAVLGWVAGNVYVLRSRGLLKALRRRFWLIYFLGPPSLIYLLRSFAPATAQAAVPLAPVYGCLVFSIFFLVPVSFSRGPRRRRPR